MIKKTLCSGLSFECLRDYKQLNILFSSNLFSFEFFARRFSSRTSGSITISRSGNTAGLLMKLLIDISSSVQLSINFSFSLFCFNSAYLEQSDLWLSVVQSIIWWLCEQKQTKKHFEHFLAHEKPQTEHKLNRFFEYKFELKLFRCLKQARS